MENHTEDNIYVKLSLDIGKSRLYNFLLDTGADVSVIKESCVIESSIFYPTLKCQIKGVTSGVDESLGLVPSKIIFTETFSIAHNFQIVNDEFPIPCSGIIGKDFLTHWQCKIDFENLTLEIPFEATSILLDLITSSSKLIIPPRSEQIINVRCNNIENNAEYLCLSKEIISGVFVGNTIVEPRNQSVTLNLINTNDKPVQFLAKELTFDKLVHYDIFSLKSWNNTNTDRLKTIESSVSLSHLNQEERESIRRIIREYNDVFHLEGDLLTAAQGVKHSIPIKSDSVPIYQKSYRMPDAIKKEINGQVDEMLKQNIIEPSESPWNFPLLAVPKKSGDGSRKWRVVVDFRHLNDITLDRVYPLPNIVEILDQLGKSSYFTSLDMTNGYHQVLLDEDAKPKTAFNTSAGHFHFNRMPFGLKGAPATFQHLMNTVLSGLNGLKCLVYLDDIVIYGQNLYEHNKRLREVLDCLRTHKLKLNPVKCQFLRQELTYLGHIVGPDGVKPDPEKVGAVVNYPEPKTQRDVRAFLGFVGYYRRFVKDFSKITLPLTALLKKETPFVWSPFCDEAFKTLKSIIVKPPILQFPNFDKMFIITTDASDIAIGSVLSQVFEAGELPIAFASRTLTKAEKNYSVIEKELLAVVWSIKHFRAYLYGRKFKLISDHKPLVWLFGMSNPSSRLMRWRLELEEYDFEISYKPGALNKNADALSRISIDESKLFKNISLQTPDSSNKSLSSPSNSYNNQQTSSSEPNLTSYKHINAVTRSQTKPEIKNLSGNPSISENKPSNNNSSKLTPLNGSSDQIHPQPNIIEITDPNNQLKLIQEFHDTPLGGHQGIQRTYKRMRKYYYFPKMLGMIEKFIKSCDSCQKNKASPVKRMPMTITSTSNKPFEKIFLDIVGPLLSSYHQNKYILTIMDDLTKYAVAVPIPNQEAETVANALLTDFVSIYGCPQSILTDQGTNFMSSVFQNLCKLLRIKKINTSAFHPQSNGALERSHRTLIEYIRHFIDENGMDWDSWIRYSMFVYNTTPHSTTNFMPYELVFGMVPNLPLSFHNNPNVVYNYDDFLVDFKHKLQKSYDIARQHAQQSKLNSKIYYDHDSNNTLYNVGDLVWLRNENKKTKLSQNWIGPYKVLEIISPVNCKIEIGRKSKIVHNNRLKLKL